MIKAAICARSSTEQAGIAGALVHSRWFVVVFAVFSACTTQAPPVSDVWERSRQCADAGNEFARELRSDAGTAPTQVSDWTTHYNETRQRCYVLVGFFNGNATPGGLVPLSHQRIYDAFERRDVATFTSQRLVDGGDKVWCRQTDERSGETSSPACAEVGKYVAELMRQ